ncbi:MAG TPA: hypothetical protein PK496_10025 [Bacteroidales bacterium]|nr:hypothetical protein [Bacteroidales bacterium]
MDNMIDLIPYTEELYNQWNELVSTSCNGTLFHRLDFLGYHKDKFTRNIHNLVWLKKGSVFAVLPMQIINGDEGIEAVSPYGASFGGIVTGKPLNYSESCRLADTFMDFLKGKKVKRVSMVLPPVIYDEEASETLIFALLERGFSLTASDITSAVPLCTNNSRVTRFRTKEKDLIRKSKRTQRLNVVIRENAPVDDFWHVVKLNFDKHNTSPTHTITEWSYLCEKFPDLFCNWVAYLNEKPIAGIGQIKVKKDITLAFYLCSDPEYYYLQALTSLLYSAMLDARSKGARWYDLGTSSYNMHGRQNIFQFKESFGALGFLRRKLKFSDSL